MTSTSETKRSKRPAKPAAKRASNRGTVLVGVAGGLLLASGGLFGAHFLLGKQTDVHAATNEAAVVTPEATAPIDLATLLADTVKVRIGSNTVAMRWSDLGVIADGSKVKGSAQTLAAAGKLPLTIDRDVAIAALIELKSHNDTAPTEAYLDLEGRRIQADAPGYALDVLASLPRLALAARSGAESVELATVALPARLTAADLGIDDISTVIGHYTTKFSVSDKARNFNLKLAASKLNGYVLQPGVEFSFNGVVGERTEKQGYKIAHVISAGEMVDGLAGGTCQISTTLFAASFFAGLDVVKQSPHSRPSVYAAMGLDATVSWPNLDLKLKNPYDFPVVVHYKVAAGEATVELLGKEKPFDQVVFNRQIVGSTPYVTEERPDDKIIVGETSIDQEGFKGYSVVRTRTLLKGDKEIKKESWRVSYRPVTEYVRVGTSLELDAKPAKVVSHHSLQVPGGSQTITQ